jgi:hypothetical protein
LGAMRLSASRLAIALVAALLMAVLAGPASAKTETDTAGVVKGSFSYTKKGPTEYTNFRLDIERNGALLLRTTLPKYKGFWPGGFVDQPSLSVEDLNGDGEPEVLLNLYSGGAHCCVSAVVYRYLASSNSYKPLVNDFGDAGFKLRNLDKKGVTEFLSADPVFSGAFTSYAETRFPIQILRFGKDRFVDVTTSFPALIRKDLAAHKKAYPRYRKRKANVRGVFAAIVADQYRLKSTKGVAATYREAQKVVGAGFVRSLKRFMKRYGYAR